jgi:hypothetical protein
MSLEYAATLIRIKFFCNTLFNDMISTADIIEQQMRWQGDFYSVIVFDAVLWDIFNTYYISRFACSDILWVLDVMVLIGKVEFSLQRSGSIPQLSIWDLLWTNWHWDRFLSQRFGLLMPATILPILLTHKSLEVFTFFVAAMPKDLSLQFSWGRMINKLERLKDVFLFVGMKVIN